MITDTQILKKVCPTVGKKLRGQIKQWDSALAESMAVAEPFQAENGWTLFKESRLADFAKNPTSEEPKSISDLQAEFGMRRRASWAAVCQKFCDDVAPLMIEALRSLESSLAERLTSIAASYGKHFADFDLSAAIGTSPLAEPIESELLRLRELREGFEASLVDERKRKHFFQSAASTFGPWIAD